jgi:hypothetical protein
VRSIESRDSLQWTGMHTPWRIATRAGLEPVGARELYGSALLLAYACAHELFSVVTGSAFGAWKWIALPLFTLKLGSGWKDAIAQRDTREARS